ncbi:hypothetical protein ACJ72_04745 [Emergomyces africanus]|uniref:5'-3' DNA helicase ZGRF1-like N-terminal domain-containing protein n=1 Tax=Emergomyces africanus TaxID=1955775 RepID=A0A1B7NVW9_9EURO|nr:hypothetical protein ACJ72_04745 [Emergomyces africanus]
MNSSAFTTVSANTPLTCAPVSKYRCLFSHDIRRKAKRWQDGFLRFHSFNKRVMVYDTQNNFIGDLHWRDGEELNDGDELELERGVLVQVGECVEKTQTDLTELLDKRKHATTSRSSPAKAFSPDASSARSAFAAHHHGSDIRNNNNTVPNSSGRLKSLNELLGIRKTPIGRATLPSRSPYEQRHRIMCPDHDAAQERAPKRQRVDSREQKRDVDGSSRQHPLRDSSSYSSVSNSRASFQPAGDVACNSISRSAKSSSKDKDAPNAKQKGNTTKSQTVIDLTNPTKPVNTLKLAIEKPRKKLMYRDLLLAQPGQGPAPKSKPSLRERESDVRTIQPQLPVDNPAADIENIPPAGSGFRQAALTSTEISSALHFMPSTSTLRILQEADPPPSSQKTKSINEFFKPSSQKPPPGPATERHETTSSSSLAETLQPITSTTPATENIPPHPNSPDKPQYPQRSLTRSHSDAVPSLTIPKYTSLPAPPEPPINPAPQTIRRSHSPLPFLALAESSEPPPPPTEQKSANTPPPKSVQRALSDVSSLLGRATTSTVTAAATTATATTTITTTSAAVAPRTRQSLLAPKRNQHVATCVDVDEEDQGPWTEEALDLFDWWPAGRPKPERRKVIG